MCCGAQGQPSSPGDVAAARRPDFQLLLLLQQQNSSLRLAPLATQRQISLQLNAATLTESGEVSPEPMISEKGCCRWPRAPHHRLPSLLLHRPSSEMLGAAQAKCLHVRLTTACIGHTPHSPEQHRLEVRRCQKKSRVAAFGARDGEAFLYCPSYRTTSPSCRKELATHEESC